MHRTQTIECNNQENLHPPTNDMNKHNGGDFSKRIMQPECFLVIRACTCCREMGLKLVLKASNCNL
jgi:hypothetical protein